MQSLILVLHVLVAVFLIVLVLMQHGKGADAGASFGAGGGASGTMFGSQGSTSFLMRITSVLALVFFITSLSLAYFAGHSKPAVSLADSIADQAPAVNIKSAPIVPEKDNIPSSLKTSKAPAESPAVVKKVKPDVNPSHKSHHGK